MKLILIFILSAALFACDSGGGSGGKAIPNVQVMNSKPGIGDIVVAGDSLAYGLGSTAKNKNVTPAGCLASLPHNQVVNVSKPGATSQDMFDQMNKLNIKPKLIFISAGGNDIFVDQEQPGAYPVKKTQYFTERAFDLALESGALVVYLGLNPPSQGIDVERLPEIAQLAFSKGVIVVDGMDKMWGNPALMSDQIHPNDQGYKIMCDRILKAIDGFYP